MSEAMRSVVNGLTGTVVTAGELFFGSVDGVDDKLGHGGVDDADDDEAPAVVPLLLL